MINKIITSEGNVQFIYGDSGKIINVHPFHVYTVFNVDTVSFLLIAMPKDSGLAIFTTKAEDLEVNGETYTFEELPNALSEAFAIAGAQARAEIVDELPETGMTNTIYLVPKEDGHGYDEYIYIKETGTWELIGDTDIELSRYVKKTDFNAYTAQTAAKIDYLSGATDAEVARAIAAENEKTVTISLSQAEYDALPSSAKTDATKLYVISDALPIDLSVYAKVSALTAEESARIAADSALTNAINAEENRAKAVESGLSESIDVEEARALGAESDLEDAISAETIAREAADSFISGAVDTLSTALANEVQRAQNAESGLSEDIEDEMTRAMVIEDALDDKIDAVSAATDDALALKQDVLEAGENITINGNVISAEGGGKAVSGGTNISITTGETADTINCTLPLTYEGQTLRTSDAVNLIKIGGSLYVGFNSVGSAYNGSFCLGRGSNTYAVKTIAAGDTCTANKEASQAFGKAVVAKNFAEHSVGQYNVSSSASTSFGDSGNTLFSVGNGTANDARHNAFEIRQNGDIYIQSGNTDIKLQDALGGSSYTAGDGIDITNDVISVTGKANSSDVYLKSETSGATEISNALDNISHALDRKVEYIGNSTIENNVLGFIWGLNDHPTNRSKLFSVGSGLSLIYDVNIGSFVLSLQIDELEETIARALNDLNDRITAIESRLNN